ncbi:flavin-containing monooxygenase FMO GS-OX-like 7 [Chelonus insularis]|uniref:flavin-containing monooxygenase FMO GS-OX-like 7 n=1 Tax=Chelonus insularis TaxID=460826 RepID=UPI00158D6A02|nr:flavin-containing monooxygenase FMO GS-OX-like 7 [Chelonus insularis]
MPSGKITVAVIGAGVAGLIVVRHISAKSQNFNVTLFEQTDKIGGTWVYTDETELDKNGLPIHSSMYKNLRTNLPKEIMQIPDFPFKNNNGPSFVHHSVIRQYLQDYAHYFNLYPHIRFNTLVKNIEPKTLSNNCNVWSVTCVNLITNTEYTKSFNVIILCNGHYTVGNIPLIRGIDDFRGNYIHSHQYRFPEKYLGKRVCILGASWSGIDIAIEVSKFAKKIYLSHNLPERLESVIADNVEERPGIKFIHENTIYFDDDSKAIIDDIIFCTGYQFTYPFMSEKVKIKTENNYVEPIYKHLIHTDMPNLFFMGLPALVIPFPMFHLQSQYILKILEGSIQLPSSEKMRIDSENEKKMLLEQGIPIRHIGKMKERQWAYYDEIAAAANIPSFPPVIKKIYHHTMKMRQLNLMTYKDYHYKIIDNENFTFRYC